MEPEIQRWDYKKLASGKNNASAKNVKKNGKRLENKTQIIKTVLTMDDLSNARAWREHEETRLYSLAPWFLQH